MKSASPTGSKNNMERAGLTGPFFIVFAAPLFGKGRRLPVALFRT
jgi:hypothetical protein